MPDMRTTTSSVYGMSEEQTLENTTAPFQAPPKLTPAPGKKSTGFTKEMRDAKIASGWIPPEQRKKTDTTPMTAKDDVKAVDVASVTAVQEAQAILIASGWAPPKQMTVAEEEKSVEAILESLVAKLTAMENNAQYRSVWLNFFNHGGVYQGPNYAEELRVACNYLNSKKT